VASLFGRARALKSLGVPAATERESDRRSRIDGEREAEAIDACRVVGRSTANRRTKGSPLTRATDVRADERDLCHYGELIQSPGTPILWIVYVLLERNERTRPTPSVDFRLPGDH